MLDLQLIVAVFLSLYNDSIHEFVSQWLVVLQPGDLDGFGGLPEMAFEGSVLAG